MKPSDTLKLILLVIHLPHSMESGRDSEISVYDENKVKGESSESWYIVLVTTAAQHGEYRRKACTGTLIRSDLVLTLASCLLHHRHDDPYPEATKVYERPTGNILQALKIFINPNFYSEDRYVSNAHDFGLIVVERSDQSEYPNLPHHSYDFKEIKNLCVMGGYGTNKSLNVINNFEMYDMRTTKVDVYKGRDCASGVIICLHFPTIQPCKADFGTPLICNSSLYALYIPAKCVRWSTCLKKVKCLGFYITAFSPVYNIKEWVKQIMDVPTSNLEWLNNPWYVLILCFVVFIFMAGIYYGLVEFLQRTFDPAEGMQTQMDLDDDDKDDEESWYESQWVSR